MHTFAVDIMRECWSLPIRHYRQIMLHYDVLYYSYIMTLYYA